MALVPGSRLGPYEVTAQIGEGGMGQVYRARDTKLQRDVALKVLPGLFANDPDRLARFTREAQTLAALNHPNIAHIHGLEESTSVRALVMELVEGEDLSRRIARGAIPLDEALPIARQIADALEAAHEYGIVHRDLKPANIKVRTDGTVKVLDFGLAKVLHDGVQSSAGSNQSPTLSLHATEAGAILGTAAYMSPEQARGRRVDRRSDVWAFGAVLYEMLTGRRAFEGESVSDTLAFVITKEPDWTRVPPSVTQSVRNLLARCLTKDPRMRLRDIGEARIAIDAITSGAGAGAEPVMTAPGRAPLRRRILPWAFAALAVAAVSSWMVAPDESPLPVRRFTLPISPALPAIGGPLGGLALSPDGNTLVYTSVTGLVRRRLDSSDFDPIRGTEKGAGSPFFSPDGAWIAFFTDNELRKVPVGGGLSVRICGTLPGRGSWADDDTIAFGSDAGLFLVSSSGGTPTRLASSDSGVATQVHWLPGSQALLVGARGGTVAHTGLGRIDVINRHTGEATRVIDGGAPQLAPTGDLLFVRAGSVWAVGFDIKQRVVRGEPVAVIESVAGTGVIDQVFFAVSRDGTAVYVDGSQGADRSLVWIDRTGQTTPALQSKGGFQMPRLSPDDTRVVTTVQNGSEFDLWAYEFERGTRRKLTTGGFSRRTAWSPDGTTLAFYSIPEDSAEADLFVVPSAGGEMTRLLARPGTQFPSSWSPDGGVLLFEETEATSGRRDIWMLPKGGAPQELMVTKAYERGAVFSPNGRSIAFVSDESGRPEVYVQQFPGPASKVTVSSNGGLQPVWARNGRELFYRESEWLMKTNVEQTPFHISKAQRMFELRGDTYNFDPNFADYDVAADGRFIAARNDRRETNEFKIVLNWTTELQRARRQQK